MNDRKPLPTPQELRQKLINHPLVGLHVVEQIEEKRPGFVSLEEAYQFSLESGGTTAYEEKNYPPLYRNVVSEADIKQFGLVMLHWDAAWVRNTALAEYLVKNYKDDISKLKGDEMASEIVNALKK